MALEGKDKTEYQRGYMRTWRALRKEAKAKLSAPAFEEAAREGEAIWNAAFEREGVRIARLMESYRNAPDRPRWRTCQYLAYRAARRVLPPVKERRAKHKAYVSERDADIIAKAEALYPEMLATAPTIYSKTKSGAEWARKSWALSAARAKAEETIPPRDVEDPEKTSHLLKWRLHVLYFVVFAVEVGAVVDTPIRSKPEREYGNYKQVFRGLGMGGADWLERFRYLTSNVSSSFCPFEKNPEYWTVPPPTEPHEHFHIGDNLAVVIVGPSVGPSALAPKPTDAAADATGPELFPNDRDVRGALEPEETEGTVGPSETESPPRDGGGREATEHPEPLQSPTI
ncbi:MAG: hypothetical protein ACHQ2Y_10035 [Candidatus Lutacidiplasmatales archaeon]